MTGDKDRWVRFQVNDTTLPGWGAIGFSATSTQVLVPTAPLQAYEKDRRASARRTKAEDAGQEGVEANPDVDLDGSHPAPGASDVDPSHASPTTQPSAWPDPPQKGWYRVLPTLETLLRRLDAPTATMRSFHTYEQDARITQHLERLRSLGPDRRLAHNPCWRSDLDALKRAMPNFAAPLDLVASQLALAEFSGKPMRIPPMLLLGPPGVGKTHFTQALAQLLHTSTGLVSFDGDLAGSTLRGMDRHWSNASEGLLYQLLCEGEYANPVILLDELDKGQPAGRNKSPVLELLGPLEPVSARCLVDASLGIEFDASMVTYVATANDPGRVDFSVLSRFSIFSIDPPALHDRLALAKALTEQALRHHGLEGRLRFSGRALAVLAHCTPRVMTRCIELALGQAVLCGKDMLGEDELLAIAGLSEPPVLGH